MSNYTTEAEVRFRIMQALKLSPQLTIGMLQAFLTSRIPHNARDVTLSLLEKEGKVRFENRVFHSFRGHTSVARVVVLVEPHNAILKVSRATSSKTSVLASDAEA